MCGKDVSIEAPSCPHCGDPYVTEEKKQAAMAQQLAAERARKDAEETRNYEECEQVMQNFIQDDSDCSCPVCNKRKEKEFSILKTGGMHAMWMKKCNCWVNDLYRKKWGRDYVRPWDKPYNRYDGLIQSKNKASTFEEFSKLAEEFNSLEGYEDSAQLALECENQARQKKYQTLVSKRGNAKTIEEWRYLSYEFKSLNDYENSAKYTLECDLEVKKLWYNELIQRKDAASSSSEYHKLINEFLAMNSYEDSDKFVLECKNLEKITKYNELQKLKSKANTFNEFSRLVIEFNAISDFQDSAKMAVDCDNSAKKNKYHDLLQLKTKATTIEDYNKLVIGFKSLDDYEDSKNLANNCEVKLLNLNKRIGNKEKNKQRLKKFIDIADEVIPKIGLFLQFGIFAAFMYILYRTDIIRSLSTDEDLLLFAFLMPAGISIIYGIISLIFRRNVDPPFPWGIGLLLIAFAIICVTSSVWEGLGLTSSIVFAAIPTIPLLILCKSEPNFLQETGIKDFFITLGLIIGLIIIGSIVQAISKNGTMVALFVFYGLALPGMILLSKAEFY